MQARGDGSVSLKLEKCDTVAAEVKKKEPRERERERKANRAEFKLREDRLSQVAEVSGGLDLE